MRVPLEELEHLVARALDGLPEEFAEVLENVAVVVEEEPPLEELEAEGLEADEEIFGLYIGRPLPERSAGDSELPDCIAIYRGPILRHCRDRREVIREVRDTLIHELGHYFGLEDEDMPY